jgi:fructoselysine-6-P-deglycase FrlB-like protein
MPSQGRLDSEKTPAQREIERQRDRSKRFEERFRRLICRIHHHEARNQAVFNCGRGSDYSLASQPEWVTSGGLLATPLTSDS